MNSDFYQQIQTAARKPAPVELWDPPLSGQMDCLIKRDGSWWIEGSKLEKDGLRRLFSSVLKRENDDYFLVSPVEKWQIQVEDLPFLIVELDIIDKSTETQSIRVRSNLGDWVTIDAEHPVESSRIDMLADDQPIPFVHMRKGLMARLNRNTFLELAELLIPTTVPNHYLLHSAGNVFELNL